MDDTRTCTAFYAPLPPEAPHYATMCRPCFVAAKKREFENETLRGKVSRLCAQRPQAIEPTMLRRLIQPCHTERHGGAEAAGIATRWPIQQRDRARELRA